MKSKHIAAAITGDVIASQRLPLKAQKQLVQNIVSAAKSLQHDHPTLIHGNIDVFRGEGWQFYCSSPKRALTAAFLFKTYLRGLHNIDTRYAIGIGAVDQLELERISTSQGEAFLLSGRALDHMPSSRQMAIACPPSLSHIHPFLEAITCSLEASTTDWTQKQALAVTLASTGNSNEHSAQLWPQKPISKQAFGKHLAKAQWDLLHKCLQQTESALEETLSNR